MKKLVIAAAIVLSFNAQAETIQHAMTGCAAVERFVVEGTPIPDDKDVEAAFCLGRMEGVINATHAVMRFNNIPRCNPALTPGSMVVEWLNVVRRMPDTWQNDVATSMAVFYRLKSACK